MTNNYDTKVKRIFDEKVKRIFHEIRATTVNEPVKETFVAAIAFFEYIRISNSSASKGEFLEKIIEFFLDVELKEKVRTDDEIIPLSDRVHHG